MINNRAAREFLNIFKVHPIMNWFFGTSSQVKKFSKYSYVFASLEA